MEVVDARWLVMTGAISGLVLLVTLCLKCRTKGPLVSIRQRDASEEYIPNTSGFRVIHSYQHSTNMDRNLASPLLLPCSPSLDPGAHRHNSFTPTENESIPSYENSKDVGGDYENTRDDKSDKDYIEVLPDLPNVDIRQSNQSLASTHSSADVEPPYLNVDPNSGAFCLGNDSYLNVDLNPDQGSTSGNEDKLDVITGTSQQWSCDKDSDDDDDYEANYVNQ